MTEKDPLMTKITAAVCDYLAEQASTTTTLRKLGWDFTYWSQFLIALKEFGVIEGGPDHSYDRLSFKDNLDLPLEELFFQLSRYWPGRGPGLHIQSEAYIQYTQDVRTVIGTVMSVYLNPTVDLTSLGFNPARRNFFGKILKQKGTTRDDAPYELLMTSRTIEEVVAAIRPYLLSEVPVAS